ncbi:Sybindin-like protein, partial [Gaertneriomyces semiglobifer]
IYNLYIFDRHCQLIFFSSWSKPPLPARPNVPTTTQPEAEGSVSKPGGAQLGATGMELSEEAKLVYGVIFSLRNLVNKLSPQPESDGFLTYKTSHYKLHYFETPTSLKFVMTTDPYMDTMREVLRTIYAQIYVEYVVKNPLCAADQGGTNSIFRERVTRYVAGLPGYD